MKMGTNSLPSAVDGTPIPATDHNSIKEALGGDLVPRNTSGVATANAGDIGTETYPIKRAAITSGYFFTGQIIPFHTYNGLLSPGQGWMKCDGTVVSEVNYNTEHGSGSWAIYVVTSTLTGKNLPDLTVNKYLIGASSTAQDGTAPLTTIGNANSTVNVQHSHSNIAHAHKWYTSSNSASVKDTSWDKNGFVGDLTITNSGGVAPDKTSSVDHIQVQTAATAAGLTPAGDLYTQSVTSNTDNQLGSTLDIRPDSIEVIYYMRII